MLKNKKTMNRILACAIAAQLVMPFTAFAADHTYKNIQTAISFEEVNRTAKTVKEAVLREAPNDEAEVVRTLEEGALINVTGIDEAFSFWRVECADGETYYMNRHNAQLVDAEPVETAREKIDFEKKNLKAKTVRETPLKDEPYDDVAAGRSVKKDTELTITGVNEDYGWYRVEDEDGKTAYVNRNNLSVSKEAVAADTGWTGPRLSPAAGAIQGPTGRETYYNLPMGGVIAAMRAMGNNDEYWVREDGAKMLGDYVMVAANYSVFPKGSLVPCSLGMAIVCDTGGFAAHNPTQLDIATNW